MRSPASWVSTSTSPVAASKTPRGGPSPGLPSASDGMFLPLPSNGPMLLVRDSRAATRQARACDVIEKVLTRLRARAADPEAAWPGRGAAPAAAGTIPYGVAPGIASMPMPNVASVASRSGTRLYFPTLTQPG